MFDYFVSLGPRCPVAASMSKYGLRSFSGPFDWLITTNFSWVLHYMETDFKDFLLQENLEKYDENPKRFRDRLSDVIFIHERENFEEEYAELKAKYDRRINRFLEKSKARVCYLRSLRDKEELEYIMSNGDYIESVIKKKNGDSEIVFLSCDYLNIPDEFKFPYYKIPGIYSGASRANLRAHFDGADDFLNFCGENYSGLNLIKNLSVDMKTEKKFNDHLELRKYTTLTTLLTHDFSSDIVSDKVIIYGAGIMGVELYKKIRDLTTVLYFIDQLKAGGKFEDVKIISADEMVCEDNVKIIVSVTYDFQKIRGKLLDKFPDEDIISLDKLLKLKF